MQIPLPFLEKAIRSQFVLLPGTLYCNERKRKGLAFVVFIGLAEKYGHREDRVRAYLKLDERTFTRYQTIFESNTDRVDVLTGKNRPINPDSIYGKIRNKSSLVESYIRFNFQEESRTKLWP